MSRNRPMSRPALALLASRAVLVLGAALAHAGTADDARLRQLAGQAGSYSSAVATSSSTGPNTRLNVRSHSIIQALISTSV